MEITRDVEYLRLLAKQYPSIRATSTAIIQLAAQLDLPKGTEHFISDIHGEYEAFQHVLRNGSGSIRRYINELFGETLSDAEKRTLATIVYYPEYKLPLILQNLTNPETWYDATLHRLVKICRLVASKYPRTAVESFFPAHFAAIIEELLYIQEDQANRGDYYQSLIKEIIATHSAPAIITTMAELIQRLAIAHLHVIGDIYDRGPGAHLILDTLLDYHSVDIQWGNHDILWMGAAAGSEACIANVVRLCLRHANLEMLENGYGISLLPLALFAIETYADDPCEAFQLKPEDTPDLTDQERRHMAQMHKAITMIQLKLEGQLIMRRPGYQMSHRLLLDKIDLKQGTVMLDDREYPLLDTHFPTIDPGRPYALSANEQGVIDKLKMAFVNNSRLQRHVRFLFSKGSIYQVYNSNLLYHGCIPTNPDGSFKTFQVDERTFTVREFLEYYDRLARQGYYATDDPLRKQEGQDAMWYLWSGDQSPLFGKQKMATFERYFIADMSTHTEARNLYYTYRDREEFARKILQEFNLHPDNSHIINGHVPVQVKKGESPVKAGGRLIVIDGGFSKAYQSKTGIAGYTLVFNSYGLLLAAHQPFESTQIAVEDELDLASELTILERSTRRLMNRDTDRGRAYQRQITDLAALLEAYREGLIKES